KQKSYFHFFLHLVPLYFFSSRRRHTRSYGDWSSDVCSSDLTPPPECSRRPPTRERCAHRDEACPSTPPPPDSRNPACRPPRRRSSASRRSGVAPRETRARPSCPRGPSSRRGSTLKHSPSCTHDTT